MYAIVTERDYINLIKKFSFRGKIIKDGFCKLIIRVRTDEQIECIKSNLVFYAAVGIHHEFEKLKWWECWFPRFQIN